MIDSPESYYGKVAKLKDVCWLEIWAYFQDIPPGTYDVRWRIKLHDFRLNALNLKVYTREHTYASSLDEKTQEELADINQGNFFFLPVARITIGTGHSQLGNESTNFGESSSNLSGRSRDPDFPVGKVDCSIICLTGQWKHGLFLDFAELRPVVAVNGVLPTYTGQAFSVEH